jgi:tetratricopeptide (TPR) repeat protein
MSTSSAAEGCCQTSEPRWTQRVIQGHLADIHFCFSCGTVYDAELYAVPLRLFPVEYRCVNCGGQLDMELCPHCSKSEDESVAMHEELTAQLHLPDMLRAALAMSEEGRHALALKLASAAVKWGSDPITARVLRLEELQALGEHTRALNEAFDWVEDDAPTLVWGVIAQMEVGRDNHEGAIHALERGLHQDPENTGLTTDYAEIMTFIDNRPSALHYATKGLKDPAMQERSVAVIADIGERFYVDGKYNSALKACARAGSLQDRYIELSWIRARIYSVKEDQQGLKRALQTVLAIDPNHAEAARLMATIR